MLHVSIQSVPITTFKVVSQIDNHEEVYLVQSSVIGFVSD